MAWLTYLCAALLSALLLLIAGCASVPSGAPSEQDGPLPEPPAGLTQTPDALPKIEAIRQGGPNRPYTVDGRNYVPVSGDAPMREKGIASWYGRKFHGKATASGELYDMHAMTAAHPTMPLPSYARVRNPANGREVIVRVNDRGPFVSGRIIDLSYTAALRLGLDGVGTVEVERLTHEDIRAGTWRNDAQATARAPVVVSSGVVPIAATAAESVAATAPREASPAASVRPLASAAPGYWVQLGAFRQREGADNLLRQVTRELASIAPLLSLFEDGALHRLQAGPYAGRDEANAAANRLREALKLVPLVVERK